MSAGIVLIAGMASVCSSLCSASSFYVCTDGTLEMNNFSANTCTAFFSSNCLTIDTQEKCDDKDACQWDEDACVRVKDIEPDELPHGIDARYVKLFHEVESNVINVAEIEVYDYEGTKLTSNTTSNIIGYSTQHDAHEWPNLIDGSLTTFGHSAGGATGNQYATIDLGETKKIYKVVVENRRDCCQDRILGARVELGTSETKSIASTPRISTESNTYTYKFVTGTSQGWVAS
jgi:hypothetical protein